MKDLKTDPPEPTSVQCTAHAIIEHEGQRFTACWYPQMGGYVAHCLVIKTGNSLSLDGCFEAFVWHDGEFPFSEAERSPTHLHHCGAEQFIRFGEFVREIAT